MTWRAANPAAREVVDVFGLTDEVIDLADQAGKGCATALARHITDLRPRYVEYDGGWAHLTQSPIWTQMKELTLSVFTLKNSTELHTYGVLTRLETKK